MPAWSVGDHLTHRFNSELGTGCVTAIEGRVLVVHFPSGGTTLRLAATSDALVPHTEASRRDRSLLERLADGDVDNTEDFLTRLDILRLLATREAGGLGSFLGGRVLLFPHQLHVAARATARLPVRWLLADEVGLGKTIEAALIMNRLLHTLKIERCLVVAPEALTVQWLGELWRKYHHVFTLLDAQRLADVDRDFGAGFNPFDVHRRAVIALETLVHRPELTALAVAAGIDLLVVDEAQRLRRPPGHPGEPAYRAVAPIAARRRPRPAAQRDATRRRCARVLPASAGAAARGVSRAIGRRGAARAPACRCPAAPARRGGSILAACRRACRLPSICGRPR